MPRSTRALGIASWCCLAGSVLLPACATSAAPPRPEEAPAPPASAPAPPAEAPGAPAEESTAPPAASGAPEGDPSSAPRPDGAPCSRGEQCESGVCEGQGCGPDEARCVPRSRPCTRDLRPYCGCDGVTFRSSGNCPGRPYLHRDPCP